MKNLFYLLVVATCAVFFSAPSFAFDIASLGSNITINDDNPDVADSAAAKEDGETEPGMVNNQNWDLEGFFLDQGNNLSMVGGYNFVDGYGGYASGDIFLSTGLPRFGESDFSGKQTNLSVPNSYGYDHVLDLGVDADGKLNGDYNVYRIDDSATVLTAFYLQNEGSSPWQYVSGGTFVEAGSFTALGGLTNDETGFKGGLHYLLTGFDLSFLGHQTDFYSHFTMGCGNDNLMGQGTVVPEPSTFLLMGAGGGLLWLVRRRNSLK